jgi:DNA mismatch repair protein MutS2
MSGIDKHSLEILEYNRIVEIIAGKSLTPFGKDQILKIHPLFERKEIEKRQAEISQMKDIINFGDSFPLVRIPDPREILERSKIENNFLEPEEFTVVLELIQAGDALFGYDTEGRKKFPAIDEYLRQLRAFPELIKAVRKVFDENGEIKDNASSELKRIRHELQDSRRRIQRLLEKKLSAYQKKAGLQDDIITQRNGRYVITIPSDQYRSDAGILQDRSQSGATLYVEPNDAVELNNSINYLYQQERLEIIRILKALTSEIAKRYEQLFNNVRIIGRIDKIHACATYSNDIKGQGPQILENAEFEFFNARHPLLIRSFENFEDVIPADISIGKERQAIVVTGPNTGGKTVSLKTVGLLILMSQSGLHIPANDNSNVGIFENIFADIGDEQSIEQSLSTFSSHINNIIRGLKSVSPNTLYLFDEIGAGTDPKEGAALAESIILYVVKSGAKIIATTHYSQLKTLPQQHPEIDNASLEFDRKTLAPTYRIQIGLPGSSYAVEIAKRLGLPQEICERALKQIGDKERSLADLITDLEGELSRVRKDKTELTERLEEAKRLEQEYRSESDKLKKETDAEKRRALTNTSEFLNTTRKEVERLVAEIRKSQASEETVKQFHQKIKDAQTQIREQLKDETARPLAVDFKKGDKVSVMTLNKEGEIEEVLDKEKVRVKIGNLFTTVEIRHLTPVAVETTEPKRRSGSNMNVESSLSPEVHLRGMTVEEALEKLDKYLDQAVVAGLHRIYVIHGKGTGTLRRILSDYLKNHSEVDSIRLGDWNEGGAGVTVVKLKE